MSKRPYKSYTKTEEENKLNKLMGVNIKEARKKAKLTQMKLTKLVNLLKKKKNLELQI